MGETWNVSTISGLDIGQVCFSPDNKYLAAVARNECIVWDCTSGRRLTTIPHQQQPIGVFCPQNDKFFTLSNYGELCEFSWLATEAIATKTKTSRIGNHLVSGLVYNPSSRHCYVSLQTSSATPDSDIFAELIHGEGDFSFNQIGMLPTKVNHLHWSVGDHFYVYIDEKTAMVHSLATENRSKSSYRNKTEIAKRTLESHNFTSVYAVANSFCAAVGYGRVYIWNNVMPRCNIASPSQSVHWHQVPPMIAMAPSGALFSYGDEGMLVRYSSARAKPSFCRINGQPKRLQLTADGSCLAIVKDDNSVHLIEVASFQVYTTFQGIYQSKKQNNLWVADHLHLNNLVSSYQPGCLQWVDAVTGLTQKTADISLENMEKNEEIGSTYYQIEDAFLATYAACTLEQRVNWSSLQKRIRLWDRRTPSLRLLDTFRVPDDTVKIAGSPTAISNEDKVFLAITSQSEILFYHSSVDSTGVVTWSEDRSRSTRWQYSRFLGCSTILPGGYWVSLHRTRLDMDCGCAVLWDLQTMDPLEVIELSSTPLYVEWATPSRFIIATPEEISAFDLHTMTFVWTVEDYLPVRCSLQGCYLMDGNQVIDFDPNLCYVKEKIEFPKEVKNLILRHIPTPSHSIQCFVACASDDSFMVAVRRNEMTDIIPEMQSLKMIKTPFANLTSAGEDATEQEARSYRPIKERRMVKPAQLFDAPAHLLPPVTHLAPIFIASCLLPPLEDDMKLKDEEMGF